MILDRNPMLTTRQADAMGMWADREIERWQLLLDRFDARDDPGAAIIIYRLVGDLEQMRDWLISTCKRRKLL